MALFPIEHETRMVPIVMTAAERASVQIWHAMRSEISILRQQQNEAAAQYYKAERKLTCIERKMDAVRNQYTDQCKEKKNIMARVDYRLTQIALHAYHAWNDEEQALHPEAGAETQGPPKKRRLSTKTAPCAFKQC